MLRGFLFMCIIFLLIGNIYVYKNPVGGKGLAKEKAFKLTTKEHMTPYDFSIVGVVTSEGMCTGFIVKKNLVATAAHCVEKGTDKVTIYFDNGSRKNNKARFVYVDKKRDISLIEVETRNRIPFVISEIPPSLDGDYLLFGIPGGFRVPMFVRFLYTGSFEVWDMYSGVAIRGFSGSPIIDRYYRVYGVLSMGEFVNMYGGVPTDTFWLAYTEKSTSLLKVIKKYEQQRNL